MAIDLTRFRGVFFEEAREHLAALEAALLYLDRAAPGDDLLNTVFRQHPFHTVRAGELERWRTGGDYDAIILGNYIRRGDPEPGLRTDYREAADYYSAKARRGMSNVEDALGRAKDAFRDAWKGSGPTTT